MESVLETGLSQLIERDSAIAELIGGGRRQAVLDLLSKYIAEIERFNPAYGLVGTNDRQELVIRHILDSLAPLGIICRLLAANACTPTVGNALQQAAIGASPLQIADVGSGAGLPGIPLAIALPHCKFTLIERMGRRANFLRNTQAVLGLGNISVEESEMEKFRAGQGRFQLVTYRAFRPLEPKLFKKLFRLCAEGGTLAAYKGRREKIEEEMASLEKICGGWEAIPCPVPLLNEERHLLVIKPA
ncbi:ribosomal RNA small subunit methyltransferase G [Spirochaetia bacterium]|nr:ribosomal RNA small subunit methyltransferase G [Spirochaetia bacterium]